MITNLIRTYIPYVVAWIVGALATLGITVTDDQRLVLVGLIGTVAAALYHLGVRLLERKWPQFSVLLGSLKQPTYATPAPVAAAPAPAEPASDTATPDAAPKAAG